MKGGTASKERRLEALYTVIALVTRARNLEKAYPRLVAAVSRYTGFPFVLIERHHRDRETIQVVARHGMPAGRLSSCHEFPASDVPSWRPIRGRRTFSMVEPGSPVHPMLKRRRIGHFISVPLLANKKVLGSLSIAAPRPATVDRGFIRFLQALGVEIGRLIDRGDTQERLEATEHRYRQFFQGALDAIFIVEPDTAVILDANPQALTLSGYSREELIGKKVFQLFPPEDLSAHEATFRKLQRSGRPRTAQQVNILRKDREMVAAEVYARRVQIGGHRLIAATIRDVSDRERAAASLKASEELLRLIVEGTQDLFFYVHDANGVFTYLSPSVQKITGHSVEEWKDVYTKFLTPNPVNQVVRAMTEETLRNGTVSPPYPVEIFHADGRPILLEINERPIVRDKRVVGIQGVARDITERKRLEEKILESRDYLNRILDQTPISVIVFDAEGNVIDVNDAWLRLFGTESKSAVVGRLNLFSTTHLQDEEIQKYIAAVYAGQVIDTPNFSLVPRKYAPGFPFAAGERSVRAKLFPVFDRLGKLVNVVAMLEDVTEQRQLEEQLLQSQKMESIGLLAGGIAHDFNNILSAILGYSSYLKTIKFDDDRVYTHLDTIERSALRAAELTSQLLAFARGGRYIPGPLDVHGVIEETVRLLRGSFDKKIAIITDLRAESSVVEGDGAQMQQVLMNLCVNARDAMPRGGKLMIRTRLLGTPDVFLLSRGADTQRPYLKIDISDTGIGIDKSIQGRIFEPFFTTKEKGKGTGLGLATVYGIVEHHGGYVDFESEVGIGTTFSIYLPTVNREVAPLHSEPPRMPGGRETILVVDDESMIRELVKDILEAKGYQVYTASDGQEALDIYREHHDTIDLVILDMIMPGMSGNETMRKLKEVNPEVKAILSSGYSEDDRVRELMDLGVKVLLQKPYRTEELSTAVRKVLDEKE